MNLIIAYTMILANAFAVLRMLKTPSYAIALMIGMYGAEQLLLGNVPFLLSSGTFYNYLVGGICVVAIFLSLAKYGIPRFATRIWVLFVSFVILINLSMIWTDAPTAGMYALKHFMAESVLGFILPTFLLRRREDYTPMMRMTILLAFIVAISILITPITGIRGRTLLVEGGTVLSPATLMGTALIFLSVTIDKRNSFVNLIRIVVAIMLLIALFMSGARMQFLSAFIISALIVMSTLRLVTSINLSVLGAIVASLSIYYLVDLESSSVAETTYRFSYEGFITGIEQRLQNFSASFTFEAPLIGHGLMGWSVATTGVDQYVYPHNSIAQVYFELGMLGLALFLSLVFAIYKIAFGYIRRCEEQGDKRLMIVLVGYFTYAFVLSLKQGTFMSCIELYIAAGMISSYALYIAPGSSSVEPVRKVKRPANLLE